MDFLSADADNNNTKMVCAVRAYFKESLNIVNFQVSIL